MIRSTEKPVTIGGRVRAATLEDVPRVVEMALHFIAASFYKSLVTANAEQLEQLVKGVIGQGIILVAEVEHVYLEGDLELGREQLLIGLLAIYVGVHPFTGRPYGDELAWWVEPEYRKGTAGHKLLCAGKEWARQNGLSVLKMVAPAGSDVGAHYEKLGFSLVETVYQITITE